MWEKGRGEDREGVEVASRGDQRHGLGRWGRQAEGAAGEGSTLRGGSQGGSAKVAPKFPAGDQPLSQQDRGLPA